MNKQNKKYKNKDFTPRQMLILGAGSFILFLIFFTYKLYDEWSDIKRQKLIHLGEDLLTLSIWGLSLFVAYRFFYFLYKKYTLNKYVTRVPSAPIGFGYKISYLAIKTTDIQKVKNFIYKRHYAFPTNWEKGITAAYEGKTFITPPVKGWTLIINPKKQFSDISDVLCQEQLKRVSDEFGEAQFYGNHRVSGYTMWSKAVHGNLIRAYSYADGIYFSQGSLISYEKEFIESSKTEFLLHGKEFNEDLLGGNDDTPAEIAEIWSINPHKIDELIYDQRELGLLL